MVRESAYLALMDTSNSYATDADRYRRAYEVLNAAMMHIVAKGARGMSGWDLFLATKGVIEAACLNAARILDED
jgi:hypothetical protein